MKDPLFKVLPHVVAIILFITLSSIFFGPAFEGYDLRQGDIAQFLGMSKEIRDYREFYDQETLWTNSMFGGMPSYQISLEQGRNVPKMIFTAVRTMFPGPIGTVFLAMLSFYILALCVRINPWLAMIGGIAFGFSSIHILYLGAGHASKVNAIALMPGVLGGVLLAYRGKILAGTAIAALFLGMHLAANHLQMTYYLLYLIVFVGVAEVLRLTLKKSFSSAIKASAFLAIGAVLAVLPNLTNILSTYEYSKHTTRGETELTISPTDPSALAQEDQRSNGLNKDYILEYSMSRGEFWSMMVPDIKGGAAGAIGNERSLLEKADRNYRENIAQSNKYWGDQRFTGGAFYFGAIIMALFIMSFFVLKDSIRWPFLLLSILAIVLSWKNASWVTDFFLENVPLFAKFRDTKMMLVLISIMAPLMGLMLVQKLIEGIDASRRKWIYIGAGAAALPLLLFLVMPGTLFDFISPAEKAQFDQYLIASGADTQTELFLKGFQESLSDVRIAIMQSDVQRSLLFVVMALVLVILLDRKVLKSPVVITLLGLLTLFDIYNVDRRYLDDEKVGRDYAHWQAKYEKVYPHDPTRADMSILNMEVQAALTMARALQEGVKLKQEHLEDDFLDGLRSQERELAMQRINASAQFGMLNFNTDYRVFSIQNPFSDARTSYFHKSLGGYHGAKLKRYNELIEFHLGPELQRFKETANTLGLGVLQGMEFANMLNAKYLITDPNSPAIENPFANGNAWFVSDIEFVPSADEEMLAMEVFRSKETAIVHDEFKDIVPIAITPDSAATIALDEYLPDHLTYSAEVHSTQLAVFSEIWYPEGWVAYVDGEETPIARANYVLRALKLEPGEHTIEFIFDPPTYHKAQTYSLIGSVLLMLFVVALAFFSWKQEYTVTKTSTRLKD